MTEKNVFKKRRLKLLRKISKGKGKKIAVVSNATVSRRNGRDLDYPFREDSNFWYLTGFSEPGAVLVLVADENPRSILFCTETIDFEKAAFDGDVCGTAGAKERYGFDEAYDIASIDEKIKEFFTNSDILYYFVGEKIELDTRVLRWVAETKQTAFRRSGPPITSIYDLGTIVSEMRLRKGQEEIADLIKAVRYTGGGIIQAMHACKPGMKEYQLDAKILEWFRSCGCSELPAFSSIVAGGANATTLHYVANNGVLRDGDLVQLDVGAEFNRYSGDISRAIPVNGKFSDAQKAVYSIVLAAQKAAIKEVVPGKNILDAHWAAVQIIVEGLVKLGILHGDVDQLIADGKDPEKKPEETYKRFFMHRTGHWLGLDTHDVGNYFEADGSLRKLEKGMVLTVEPGIYIKPAPDVPEEYWNIGIRIEDDVLVEEGEPFVLSRDVPKEIEEIEEVMSF